MTQERSYDVKWGLGNKEKKGSNKSYGPKIKGFQPLTRQEISNIYNASDIASRIVDIVPREAMREFVSFDGTDSFSDEDMQEFISEYSFKEHFREAWRFARLHGKGLLYINVEGAGSPDEPLDFDRPYRITSFTPLHRYEIEIDSTLLDSDISSANFGKPRTVRITNQYGACDPINIHHTRFIEFDGDLVDPDQFKANGFSHQSVLQRVVDSLGNYDSCGQKLLYILSEYRIPLIKMDGLKELFIAGKQEVAQQRAESIVENKSIINGILLDKNDEFDFAGGGVEGIANIVDKLKDRLKASTDIPHTILFNESPSASLGSGTGTGERNHWYDSVKQVQTDYAERKLRRCFKIMFNASNGPTKGKEPEKWKYKFNPLEQPTHSQQLNDRKIQSEIDANYIDAQVYRPEEVRKSRFEGAYNHEIELDTDTFFEDQEEDESSAKEGTKELSGSNGTTLPH